jgi:hypothetical protein
MEQPLSDMKAVRNAVAKTIWVCGVMVTSGALAVIISLAPTVKL